MQRRDDAVPCLRHQAALGLHLGAQRHRDVDVEALQLAVGPADRPDPQIARAMRIGWAMGIGCTGSSTSRTLQSPPPSWPVPTRPQIAPLRPAR